MLLGFSIGPSLKCCVCIRVGNVFPLGLLNKHKAIVQQETNLLVEAFFPDSKISANMFMLLCSYSNFVFM